VRGTREIVHNAWKAGTVVPSFNIPFLPMMEPVVRALRETGAFGLIAVARLEWVKFGAGSPRAVRDEYEKVKDERHTRLHLDHVPVIDEDGLTVEGYAAIIGEAIELGYQSVMVDGSRLPLADNIAATRTVVEMGHAADIPVEAELGAVLGHEEGPLPPYEELFVSRRGFTNPDQAGQFVSATGADWLSVAIGNVHGAISAASKLRKKLEAKLDVDHLAAINAAADVPLVLHGGTGIPKAYIKQAITHGIAKINVATGIRQPYLQLCEESIPKACNAVYDAAIRLIREELEIAGSAAIVDPHPPKDEPAKLRTRKETT